MMNFNNDAGVRTLVNLIREFLWDIEKII
jgi:hypothetical protein